MLHLAACLGLCACSSGQGAAAGRDELAAQGFNEQELLERMRSAVSCNPPQHMRQQQRRLSAFAGLEAAGGAAAGPEQQLAADAAAGVEGGVDDSAYEEDLGDSMMRQISQEMEEVLQAIDAQQQQDAATAVSVVQQVQQAPVIDILVSPPGAVGTRVWPDEPYEGPYDAGYDPDEGYADYDAAQSDYQSDAHTSHTPYTDVWEGEDRAEAEFAGGLCRACALLPSDCCVCGLRRPYAAGSDSHSSQAHRQLLKQRHNSQPWAAIPRQGMDCVVNFHQQQHAKTHSCCCALPLCATAGGQQEQQQEQGIQQQQQQHVQADSVDRLVRALPTHISDFGESPDNEDDAAMLEGLLLEGSASAAPAAPARPAAAAAAAARLAGAAAVAAGGDQGAAPHLPSHISAFGDDLEPLTGGRDVLSAGAEEEGFPAGEWRQGLWERLFVRLLVWRPCAHLLAAHVWQLAQRPLFTLCCSSKGLQDHVVVAGLPCHYSVAPCLAPDSPLAVLCRGICVPVAGLEPRLSGGQLGRTRPRTQDSSFSLDGGAFDGQGTSPRAAGERPC
jgi:hypothetical protein